LLPKPLKREMTLYRLRVWKNTTRRAIVSKRTRHPTRLLLASNPQLTCPSLTYRHRSNLPPAARRLRFTLPKARPESNGRPQQRGRTYENKRTDHSSPARSNARRRRLLPHRRNSAIPARASNTGFNDDELVVPHASCRQDTHPLRLVRGRRGCL